MKKTPLYFTLILGLGILLATSMISTASAEYEWDDDEWDDKEILDEEQWFEITYANYLDLDADGMEDDVIAYFTLRSPTGKLCYVEGSFELKLKLPSGFTFEMDFTVEETFVELNVTILLYNVAIESGWYDLHIKGKIVAQEINSERIIEGKVDDKLTFDPRDYKTGGIAYLMVTW